MSDTATALMERTALIVTAHLQNNPLTSEQVPAFIRTVHETLAALGQNQNGKEMTADKAEGIQPTPKPAVDPRRSVFPDYIICLEDGKQLKMLKRHLATAYGLTPEQYRAKWNLGQEYPMVAPNYAEMRSDLAKRNGLGNKSTQRGRPKRARA